MYLLIVMVSLVLTDSALAVKNCEIQGLKSFYDHVVSDSPVIIEAKKQKELADSQIDEAKQRPNPELSGEYLRGDEFGLDVNTFTLSAEHTFEYGNKRNLRIAKANVDRDFDHSNIELALFERFANYTLIYQKVSQLDLLIHSVNEAISTFGKIVGKLKSRKRLTPEETISLSTITLALNEYKSQLNDLVNEKNMLRGKLVFLTSCKDLNVKYTAIKYPPMNKIISEGRLGLIKLEDLKVKQASQQLEIQKSLGYSDIRIGPTVEYQSLGRDEFFSAGVSVSFAVPVFNTNDGGKLRALRKLQAQKVKTANNKKMLEIEKENLYLKYKHSLNTYENMPSLLQLEKKHKQVERLYSRGIVSIPMTIESHRQQIEFLKSRFETENDLLTTLVRISLIEGSVDKFKELIK